METGNVDVVLMRITANECNAVTEDLARHLDPEFPATEAPRRIVANVFAGPWGEPAAAYQ